MDREEWITAMNEEKGNLERNETWEIVPRPTDRRVIKSKWVFKKKLNEDGTVERYSARLVACGNAQVAGLNFNETFAPVVKIKSIRLLLAISIERDWKIYQLDITPAYLHGTLGEDVYMYQPYPFKKDPEDGVCLLKKSLYGLKQSGNEWNACLNTSLKSIGMIRSWADPCVYYSKDKELIIGVYVDDILITAKDEERIRSFKQQIADRFETKDLGEAKRILSVTITNEDKDHCASVKRYTRKLC